MKHNKETKTLHFTVIRNGPYQITPSINLCGHGPLNNVGIPTYSAKHLQRLLFKLLDEWGWKSPKNRNQITKRLRALRRDAIAKEQRSDNLVIKVTGKY